MSTRLIAAASLAALLLSGGAFAQTPPAAAPAAAPAPATAPATDKQAKSKQCSDQANAKGLHGKARKHFRSQCKQGKA